MESESEAYLPACNKSLDVGLIEGKSSKHPGTLKIFTRLLVNVGINNDVLMTNNFHK